MDTPITLYEMQFNREWFLMSFDVRFDFKRIKCTMHYFSVLLF